ncbi:VCBS domain-containing protein, partial [Amphibiibacter pelophylacis]
MATSPFRLTSVTSNSADAVVTANADGSFTVTHAYGTDIFRPDNTISYQRGELFTALPYNAGRTETSFPLRLVFSTGTGGVRLMNYSINIIGEDDAPTIKGDSTGILTEDSASAATGKLTILDPDLQQGVATQSGAKAATVPGVYGTLSINTSGEWSYRLDNGSSKVQALRAGESVTEKLTVYAADGKTPQIITLTINGQNDKATISNASATVVEDGPAGAPAGARQTASGQLTITDPDSGEAQLNVSATTLKGQYGDLTLTASGAWTYTLRNGDANVQALKGDERVSETFNVVSKDGTGQGQIVITVVGTNDAAQVAGVSTGQVREDATLSASGQLTITDRDSGEAAFVPATLTGQYGTLVLQASGSWKYELNNSAAAVQKLLGSDVRDEVFTVRTADGTAVPVTIKVSGADEALSISSGRGAVAEDGTAAATGTITGSTVGGDAVTFAAATLPGSYGKLVLQASGAWKYELDNTRAQPLKGGETATETFALTSADGQKTSVTISISGAADGATISGSTTGTVAEDTSPSVSGKLTVTDLDAGQAAMVPGTQTGTYGKLVLQADGAWKYELDAAKSQPLKGGETVSEVFTVSSVDGTKSTVTITVNGSNDAATVTGTQTATVTESNGSSTVTAKGTVTVNDVDRGEGGVREGTYTGQYGKVVLDANGQWTYTLDQSKPAVTGLNDGGKLTDTVKYFTADGTEQSITVTINGSNALASITGNGAGTVTEDTVTSASGKLTVTDLDAGQAAMVPGTQTGAYGKLVLQADGAWKYELDSAKSQPLKG